MAEYLLRIVERHGDLITIAPFTTLQYERGLLGAGKCEFDVAIDHPNLADTDCLLPWAREVQVMRRETDSDAWVCVHDGPIVGLQIDVVAGTAHVTAGTVKSFLRKREGGGYFYEPGWDLGAIADLIILRAQDRGLDPPPAGSTFFCDHPEVTTGVIRDFDTRGQNARKYDEILDEFAQGDPGFDYEFVTDVTDGVRTRTFVLHYPHQGSAIDTPLRLGSGLTALTVNVDGDRAATHYNVYGPAAGDATLIGNTFVSDTIIDEFTRLEESEVRVDINNLDRLRDISLEQLRLRTPPLRLLAGSYRPSNATPYRFCGIGDTLPILAERGMVQLNERRRTVYETVTVNGSSETVRLTFNDPVDDSFTGDGS